MLNPLRPQGAAALARGVVVGPAADLIGVPGADGDLVAPDRLGPGIVERVAPEGRARVRWMDAELDAWMEPEDLHLYAAGTQVISVYRCDGRGHNVRQAHRLVPPGMGCTANWTVELRPERVIRLVRADGLAWTFRRNTGPTPERVIALWPEPPEDADAEALTVADLALE